MLRATRADRLRLGSRGAATIAIVAAAVMVAAALTAIVRQFTFLADEWVFITARRAPSLESLLAPYNNHWQAVPVLAYQVALGLRGLAAYPLLAAIGAVGHALAALALFAALRSVRPWLAFVAALALLAFAWSDEVLLWPVNLSFTLPVAFGLAAIALWTRPEPRPATDVLGTLALLLAFMSGGVAIAIAAVATALMLARPSPNRRHLVWPISAWMVYVGWYVLLGRSGDALGNALASDLSQLPLFIARGLATLAAPALGQDYRFQLLALAVIAAAVGFAAARLGRRPLLGWIALAGVAALYGLVGLARLKNYDVDGAAAPRYLYPAFALLLLGAAAIVNQLFDSLASQRGRRVLAVVVVAWLAVALIGDAGKLSRSSAVWADRATAIRTQLWTLELLRPAIAARSAGSEPVDKRWFGGLTPNAYYRVIDDIADLPGPSASPRTWPTAQRQIADELLGRLFTADLAIVALPGAPDRVTGSADRRYGLHHMSLVLDGRDCAQFAITGVDPFVALRLRDGESIAIRTDGQRTLQVFSRVLADDFGTVERSLLPAPGTWYGVAPPALGESLPWHLRVDAPPGSSRLDVCLVPAVAT